MDAHDSRTSRRSLLQSAAVATAAVALGRPTAATATTPAAAGRLKQSVCRWCYSKIPLDDLCSAAKGMGLVGIDLLGPNDFPTIKKYGLICTMVTSHPLADGLC